MATEAFQIGSECAIRQLFCSESRASRQQESIASTPLMLMTMMTVDATMSTYLLLDSPAN